MNTSINFKVFDSFPVLQSKRLVFREYQPEDAMVLFKIRSGYEEMKFMDCHLLKELKEAQELVEQSSDSFYQKKGINWIIADHLDNKMLGYFGVWRLMADHCRGEIGYALASENWGKGYMKETFATIIPFLFSSFHLHSLEANINQDNKVSQSLLESFNFMKEAHFHENYFFEGKFVDSIIYSLLEDRFIDANSD